MRDVTKSFELVSFKADTDDRGVFTAVVSVFDNVDLDGEVIPFGAFTETLEKGLPPVVWSHNWMTPPIGVTLEAEQLEGVGLQTKGRLFIDDDSVPLARHVYKAMTSTGGDGRPALREWSVGMKVLSERFEEIDGRRVTILEKLDLAEYGPVLKGANPLTRTVAVKTAAEQVNEAATEGGTTPDGDGGGDKHNRDQALARASVLFA